MCTKWKPEGEFHKDRARKDGLKIRCTECSSAYERERKRKNGEYLGKNLKFEQRHRTYRGVKQKLCGRCNEWKKETEFYKHRRERDGLNFYCKDCTNEKARKVREKKRKEKGILGYEDRHRTVNGVKQKLCVSCKQWKSEIEFHRNRAAKDGLNSRCRVYCNGVKAANQNGKVLRRNLLYDESHRVFRGVKQKLCSYCRKWKDENSFYKGRRKKDGLSARCKECSKKYARERYTPKTKRLGSYLKYEERHRTVKGIKEKLCSECKKWKKETEYYRNRSAKDGLYSQCKKCTYKPTKKATQALN